MKLNYFKVVGDAWKIYLAGSFAGKRTCRWYLLVFTILGLTILMYSFNLFLFFIEKRNGAVLPDPLFALFQPVNFSAGIFIILYFSMISTIIFLLKKPELFFRAIHAYILIILFRGILMYLTPLEPDPHLIPLTDPFVEIAGGLHVTYTKDLFFSGHTSTMFLFFLVARNKIFKYLLLTGTFAVGTMVVCQYVHYSIDVAVAPFVSFAAYRISANIHDKFTIQE